MRARDFNFMQVLRRILQRSHLFRAARTGTCRIGGCLWWDPSRPGAPTLSLGFVREPGEGRASRGSPNPARFPSLPTDSCTASLRAPKYGAKDQSPTERCSSLFERAMCSRLRARRCLLMQRWLIIWAVVRPTQTLRRVLPPPFSSQIRTAESSVPPTRSRRRETHSPRNRCRCTTRPME